MSLRKCILAKTFLTRSTSAIRILVFLGFANLIACDANNLEEQTLNLKSLKTATYNFEQWCEEWNMECSDEVPANIPSDDVIWNLKQWQSVASVAEALLYSPSRFEVTREDLDDPDFIEFLTTIDSADSYTNLLNTLDTYTWLKLTKPENEGVIRSYFNEERSNQASSKMYISVDPVSDISITANASLVFSGYYLSDSLLTVEENLEALQISKENYLNVKLENQLVNDVPIEFMLDQFYPSSEASTETSENSALTFEQNVNIINSFTNWLFRPTRVLELERNFFVTLTDNLSMLVDAEDDIYDILYIISDSLESLITGTNSEKNLVTASIINGKNLNCNTTDGKLAVKFSDDFGLSSISKIDDQTIRFHFFGITVSFPKLFGISLKIKRVDISSDKITILDVPLIGKYVIPLEENSDQGDSNGSIGLTCAN